MNIGIYIYDDAEVLDFAGPFEVFSTADRIVSSDEIFNVFLVSESGGLVAARNGFQVQTSYGFSDHPAIDVLIVAGGVHEGELLKATVLRWIRQQADGATLVASVCTGAFLLAEAGVITDETVTTHWEDLGDLRERYPSLDVTAQRRWVDTGRIITSAGISAGIDMSLHLVSRLHSRELALKTAKKMEFAWSES